MNYNTLIKRCTQCGRIVCNCAQPAPDAGGLREAAEFALKALDEEAAAYYPDTIAHVEQARRKLYAALSQTTRGERI